MKQVLFIILVHLSFSGLSQSVKIGKCDSLEVMKIDLGKMTCDEARKACEKLGDGWRLPTIEELHFMYNKRDEIGGFKDGFYWSGTEGDNVNAWYFNFTNGVTNDGFGSTKDDAFYVRVVRDVK